MIDDTGRHKAKAIRTQFYRILGAALIYVPVIYLITKYANECKP